MTALQNESTPEVREQHRSSDTPVSVSEQGACLTSLPPLPSYPTFSSKLSGPSWKAEAATLLSTQLNLTQIFWFTTRTMASVPSSLV